MNVVKQNGQKIAQFRTVAQIEAWAKRIGLDLTACDVAFNVKLINQNEWVSADYR